MKRDIIGYGGGKGGDQHVHYEATDSLHSISYARVLDLISEGEILGLANGLQSVYLDGTPVQNADGSNNFQNISIDFRSGTQTQDPIPGFPSVESETAVNVELRSSAPWVHSITNTQLDAIRVTLAVQALSQADTTNGDINGYKIDYQIELSTDSGAYSVVLSNSFDGKTTTQYQRSARIDLPAATTGWSIRVTRLTANASTSSIADTTTIVSYTEVIDAKLRYPMAAIVGIQVDAKQFSAIPVRAYDMYGRIIQVPANYDPVARTYATTGTGTSGGTWDGTFKLAWTSNPAWIFRDLVLNDRYGLGQRISASQIDKWSLYKIAQYCDAMVPNGKGGTEPRFTCNVYLQSQKEAYAVLQDLASVFRGIAYWGGGALMTAADMPSDPVYIYTAANVIGGKFSYVGSGKKTRATVALVSWNDMSDMGRAKVEYVEDAEGIKRYGIQQISLTAFGCTSQGQAQRVGRWALATSRLETEAVSFDVGLDGAIALPGQVVRIADPYRAGRRNGGRIHSASGRDVVIDKAPTIAVGDKFTAILPTGVSETHNVAAVSGSTVTVDADWSSLPNAQSVWTVDNADLVAPLYRIISIEEKDGLTYSVTATKHEPGKYDYVENNTVIQTYSQTALDVSKQVAPASVTVTGYTVSLQDVQKLALHIACDPVAGAIAYEGAYKRDNGNWIPITRQFSPSIDIMDVLPGSYTAKLSAVNSIGVASVETVSPATAVNKNSNPLNAGILLAPSAPAFHVTTGGANSPASITFTASLLALTGTISFSCTGGTLTNITATSADLTYANMSGTTATVTASVTVNGTTYSAPCTVSKVQDGAAGANGSNGAQAAIAYLYQRASSSPPTDPGAGTFNFGTNTVAPSGASFAGGWLTSIPSGSLPLWVTSVNVTATAPATTATIAAGSWANPVILAQNGADGTNGASGTQSGSATLYKWATSAPAAPTGTSTFTWSTGANGGYSATDGWSVTVPSNPGTPGAGLYVVVAAVSAAAGVASSTVSYSGAAVQAWSQNGANGTNGSTGVQQGAAIVYQWAASIPAGPSGAATYTWSSGAFGSAPSGWTLTAGTSPSAGYTLWAARVNITDSAANSTTAFNWTSASITAQGYAGTNGTNGSNGSPGQAGSSYVTAYCASSTASTTTAPAATIGQSSYPAANSGGLTGTWGKTVPALTSGQYLYQSDGIYDPSTNQVTWSIPYWSSLKVGSLSAVNVNTGALTITGTISDGAGNWSVDSSGNVIAKALTLKDSSGNVILSSGSALNPSYAAAGTLNSGISIASNGALSGAGGGQVTIGGLGYTGDLNATNGANSSNLNVGLGGANLIPSNSLPSSLGACSFSNGGLTADGPHYDGPSDPNGIYSPMGLGCLWIHASGTPSSGTTMDLYPLGTSSSNSISVTAGQKYEFGSALSVSNCTAAVVVFFYNSSGSLLSQSSGNSISALSSNSSANFPRSFVIVAAPAGATSAMLGVRQTHNGGTDPTTYASQFYFGAALASQTVGSPWSPSAGGFADKLSKTAASILGAPITVSTGGAVQVGTAAWTGSAATGTGVVISPQGIAGVNAGTVGFSITSGGVATFGGTLQAATGSFGAVTIASGGSLSSGQTAYNTGTGWWWGFSGSTPVMSIGTAGGPSLTWNGSALTYTGNVNGTPAATVESNASAGATANNALNNGPSITIAAPASANYANGATSFGNFVATVTGGNGTVTVYWSIEQKDITSGGNMYLGTSTGTSVALSGPGQTNAQCLVTVTATAVDSKKLSATANASKNIIWGTPP